MSREMPERRDAMKELVELVAELCERIDHDAEDIGCDVRTVAEIIPLLGPAVDKARQSLSRTSDEGGRSVTGILTAENIPKGTGCVVPEAVRRLPDQWRGRVESYLSIGNTAGAEMLEDHADELDRAIAEQGGQRVPKEAVGYAAIGDDGNVKGLWVLRDWDHAEAFADSCGCSLAPVFFGPQGNALAAAPQHEQEDK